MVSGRWPFASGVTYARWVLANVIVLDDVGVPFEHGDTALHVYREFVRGDFGGGEFGANRPLDVGVGSPRPAGHAGALVRGIAFDGGGPRLGRNGQR